MSAKCMVVVHDGCATVVQVVFMECARGVPGLCDVSSKVCL
jgi:hypothetical protein